MRFRPSVENALFLPGEVQNRNKAVEDFRVTRDRFESPPGLGLCLSTDSDLNDMLDESYMVSNRSGSGQSLEPPILAKFLHQVLDLLGLGLVGDHEDIIGLDDYRITDSHERNGGAIFCAAVVDDVSLGIDLQELADDTVPVVILVKMSTQRSPRAQVVPVKIPIGTHDIFGVLHQGVIDGDLFHIRIFLFQPASKFGRIIRNL